MVRFGKMILAHNCFPITLIIMKLRTKTPLWVEDVPYIFGGQKVKGQGHNALITENGLCFIIAFLVHLSSWNFIQRLLISRKCALWISGSKGQRSRSKCINNWKWFMSRNSFPFTPIIIMKLHIKTPHVSRMCPMDMGVKRSKVKVKINW